MNLSHHYYAIVISPLILLLGPYREQLSILTSGRHRIGGQKGGIFSPPPLPKKKQCIWRKVLLKVLIKEYAKNYVWIPMLIASYNDKHWQRSGIISCLLRSIFFGEDGVSNSIWTPSLMAVFPKTFLTVQEKSTYSHLYLFSWIWYA